MTTADLDHLLRNLEKQVNDFTLVNTISKLSKATISIC